MSSVISSNSNCVLVGAVNPNTPPKDDCFVEVVASKSLKQLESSLRVSNDESQSPSLNRTEKCGDVSVSDTKKYHHHLIQ